MNPESKDRAIHFPKKKLAKLPKVQISSEHKIGENGINNGKRKSLLEVKERNVVTKQQKRHKGRMTVDGSLIPRKAPRMGMDGFFLQPPGRRPDGLEWDPLRGIFRVPCLGREEEEEKEEEVIRKRKPCPTDIAGTNLRIVALEEARKVAEGEDLELLHGSKNSVKARLQGACDEDDLLVENDAETLFKKHPSNCRVTKGRSQKISVNETIVEGSAKPQTLPLESLLPRRKKAEGSDGHDGMEGNGTISWHRADRPPRKHSPVKHEEERVAPISTAVIVPVFKKLHATSPWEEPPREDGVTLYERHRRPRPLLHGRIRRSIKVLRQELRCAICWDCIEDASMVRDCLHRFCRECINRSIRTGHSECPICRVSIPSRRSVIPDPEFDRLIQGVLGSARMEDDNEIESGMKKPTANSSPLPAVDESGVEKESSTPNQSLQQAIENKRLRRSTERYVVPSHVHDALLAEEERSCQEEIGAAGSSDSGDDDDDSDYTERGGRKTQLAMVEDIDILTLDVDIVEAQLPCLIDVTLRRYPSENSLKDLKMPFIRISGDAPVGVLKKFLQRKLDRRDVEIEIISFYKGEAYTLSDWILIENVSNFLSDTPGDAVFLLYKIEVSQPYVR